jgi:nitrite reductase (NADH) large subunit
LRTELERRGQTILTTAHTAAVIGEAILGEERVSGVALKDGTILPADIVVMAVGIRPDTALAKDCGAGDGTRHHRRRSYE